MINILGLGEKQNEEVRTAILKANVAFYEKELKEAKEQMKLAEERLGEGLILQNAQGEALICETMINACQKQIPTEYIEDIAHQEATCPTCFATLEYTNSNEQAYCEKCGQKLSEGWRVKR